MTDHLTVLAADRLCREADFEISQEAAEAYVSELDHPTRAVIASGWFS